MIRRWNRAFVTALILSVLSISGLYILGWIKSPVRNFLIAGNSDSIKQFTFIYSTLNLFFRGIFVISLFFWCAFFLWVFYGHRHDKYGHWLTFIFDYLKKKFDDAGENAANISHTLALGSIGAGLIGGGILYALPSVLEPKIIKVNQPDKQQYIIQNQQPYTSTIEFMRSIINLLNQHPGNSGIQLKLDTLHFNIEQLRLRDTIIFKLQSSANNDSVPNDLIARAIREGSQNIANQITLLDSKLCNTILANAQYKSELRNIAEQRLYEKELKEKESTAYFQYINNLHCK